MSDACPIAIGPEDYRARAATIVLTGQTWDRDAEFKVAHQLAVATKCSERAADAFASEWVSTVEAEFQSLPAPRLLALFPDPTFAPLYAQDLRARAAALMLSGLGWANELATLVQLMSDAGYLDKEAGAWLCARVVGTAYYLHQFELSTAYAGEA